MFVFCLKGKNIKKPLMLQRERSHSLTWLDIVMLLYKINTTVFTSTRNPWRFLWLPVAGDIRLFWANKLWAEVSYVIYLPIQRSTPTSQLHSHPHSLPRGFPFFHWHDQQCLIGCAIWAWVSEHIEQTTTIDTIIYRYHKPSINLSWFCYQDFDFGVIHLHNLHLSIQDRLHNHINIWH